MNDAEPLATDQHRPHGQIFVSYATADRKEALNVCNAIERRGGKCWISTRDVRPGENYQEAIVRSLRASCAMVLVFSEAANNSDEIKKELSLASRYHVPVMALRIEDVEPSDAFAYELSTRQWIDAFHGWDKSIDALVGQIGRIGRADGLTTPTEHAPPTRRSSQSRGLIVGVGVASMLMATIAGWWLLRPPPAAAHSMTVRFTGFQRLSPDLPTTMPDAVRDEILAAFGDQGVVGVSTASSAAAGPAPAYALGGTIRHNGDQIRVITKLTNERSGATLWSTSSDYAVGEASRVPRRIALDAGKMVRCGLFGASTYSKPLSDPALADYMRYCQNSAVFPVDPGKGLQAARSVTAAVPDFSWGWSAVVLAAGQNLYLADPGPQREEVRRIGLEAAAKALSLDPKNSEAAAQQSILIDARDYVAQEKLLRQAIAARPLDCGCEHVMYGIMLGNVGRLADSVSEFRHATDILALDSGSQYLLADTLTALGKANDAKQHFDAAVELDSSPTMTDEIAVDEATETGQYAAAVKAMQNKKLGFPENERAALLQGFQAMVSGDAGAKARGAARLAALPEAQKDYRAAKLLAVLGDNHAAMKIFVAGIGSRFDWPSLVWYRSMRGVLSDPDFPAVAQRLGLIDYWRARHTKPDVCTAKARPPFCQII